MYRESFKHFAAGLLTATIIFGGYYYVIDTNEQQHIHLTIDELKIASQKLGYTLIDSEEALKMNEQKRVEDDQTMDKAESTSFLLSISKGMSSDDVEVILKEQSIISDSDSLSTYMMENNLADKIQIGEFVVTKEMKLQQIAKTITK